MSLLVLAALLTLGSWTLFYLHTERACEVHGRGPMPTLLARSLAIGLQGGSFALCVVRSGLSFGSIEFVCLSVLGAMAVVLSVSWSKTMADA